MLPDGAYCGEFWYGFYGIDGSLVVVFGMLWAVLEVLVLRYGGGGVLFSIVDFRRVVGSYAGFCSGVWLCLVGFWLRRLLGTSGR